VAIHDEVQQLIKIILEHPEEIDRLKLFARMRNGNVIRYKMDRRKEPFLKLKEQQRQHKFDKKKNHLRDKNKINNEDSQS
jgi:hypothetical protein